MTRLTLPQIFLKMFSSFPFSDGFSDLMDLFYVPSKNIKNKMLTSMASELFSSILSKYYKCQKIHIV